MARLQILELPEGSSDDRPPFVLVVDELPEHEDQAAAIRRDLSKSDIPTLLGARAVLCFEGTIDIPANDVPVDGDGHPLFVKVHVEGEFDQFHEQMQQEVLAAQGKITRAVGEAEPIHERATIALDAERLDKWTNELTDALGIDRLRDWDDMRNAAAGLRSDRDAQGEALERVRNLPEAPEVMNAQHPNPADYLQGYGVAIREAKRASYPPQRTESSDTERSPEE